MKRLAEAEQAALQELGLPGALEAIETPTGIPDALILKAEQARQLGGPQGLRQTTTVIDQSRLDCEALFRQTQEVLTNESNLDNSLRTIFSTRWNRPPSHQLTESIRTQLAGLRVVLSQAEAADAKVKAELTLNESLIHKLVSPRIDLPEAPSMDTLGSFQEIRNLLDTLNTLISDRTSSLEVFLKTDTDLPLLQHFSQDELPLLTSKSHDILSQLRQSTPALHHTRQSHSACLVARQLALQDLDHAYQFFMQLRNHLDEGYSFYVNLITKMQTLHGEAEDFVMSRRLEGDELKAKVEADMEAELKRMSSYQQLPKSLLMHKILLLWQPLVDIPLKHHCINNLLLLQLCIQVLGILQSQSIMQTHLHNQHHLLIHTPPVLIILHLCQLVSKVHSPVRLLLPFMHHTIPLPLMVNHQHILLHHNHTNNPHSHLNNPTNSIIVHNHLHLHNTQASSLMLHNKDNTSIPILLPTQQPSK